MHIYEFSCVLVQLCLCLCLDLLYCLLSTEWPFHRSFRSGLLLFVWAQMTSPRKISSFLLLFFFSDDFEDRKKGTKHLMLTNNLVQVKLVSIIVLSLLSLIFPTYILLVSTIIVFLMLSLFFSAILTTKSFFCCME